MRKLDRDGAITPSCLNGFNHQSQSWHNLTATCKREVRNALVNMQRNPSLATDSSEYGVLCAYCESAVYNGGHIEHFSRKNDRYYPELTFEWSNLFWSCGSHEHCGHYKDRKGSPSYDPNYLIKPDEINPEDYLYFHSTGEIRALDKITPADKCRAEKTITVFGLNNSKLRAARHKALQPYKKKILEEFSVIESWSEEDRNEYLKEELQATHWEPYASIIKCFLAKTV